MPFPTNLHDPNCIHPKLQSFSAIFGDTKYKANNVSFVGFKATIVNRGTNIGIDQHFHIELNSGSELVVYVDTDGKFVVYFYEGDNEDETWVKKFPKTKSVTQFVVAFVTDLEFKGVK